MNDDAKKMVWVLGAIACAAILAYLPALQAGFIWDDDAYVEHNANLRSWAGLGRIWFEPLSSPQYYPLVHTTFWIEFQLFGLNPPVFHIVNLVLHLMSCVLLYVAVGRLKLPGAWIVAGLFALHPVMVESVAWITERKNVLSMVFYLGSFLCCLRVLGLDGSLPLAERGTRRLKAWYASALGLFVLALASKSVTFSLPFTVLLVVFWRRGRVTWRDVGALAPFMVLGAVYGIYTSHLEATLVGASGPEWDQSFLERILIAGRVPWFYLSKLVYPVELTFIYERWDIDTTAAWQYLFPVATLGLLAWLTMRALRGRGRGPLVAILMYGGTLFPALGFVDVYPFRYSFVADHFQYHAALGIFVLLGSGVGRRANERWVQVLVSAALALCAARSHVQCQKFESREVLYRSILADNPDGWFAHNNLAAIAVEEENFVAAFSSYKRAHSLHPILGPGQTSDDYAHAQVAAMVGRTWSLQPAIDALRLYQSLGREFETRQRAGQPIGDLERRGRDAMDRVRRLRDAVLPKLRTAEDRFRKSLAGSPGSVATLADFGVLTQSFARVAVEDQALADRWFQETVGLWSRGLEIEPENQGLRMRLYRLHLYLANAFGQRGEQGLAEAHQSAAQRLKGGR